MTVLARTPAELADGLASARGNNRTVALVPTMGSLHDGHLSLLRAARNRCDVVVMSLFVNPAQFGAGEDLGSYPRDPDRDLRLAEAEGVDLVYAPATDDVYPAGFSTVVEVGGLTDVLEGDPRHRGAGHFRGVTTIVAKLFNAIRPDVAFFGQKDAQQALVIERMVRDLEFGIEIVVVPTVREPDGLAMSSRNAYLTEAERERATAIFRSLRAVEDAIRAGESGADAALEPARRELAGAGIEPEYLEARDAASLEPIETFNGRPVLVAIAARLGRARLIDNVVIEGASE